MQAESRLEELLQQFNDEQNPAAKIAVGEAILSIAYVLAGREVEKSSERLKEQLQEPRGKPH